MNEYKNNSPIKSETEKQTPKKDSEMKPNGVKPTEKQNGASSRYSK